MATDVMVVGSGAMGVMGRVGPTSWTVLTALAIDAAANGELTVRASVRSLAADLGLNKDTVAWALVRLRRERLVAPVASRFEPSTYRLTMPADVIRFTADASQQQLDKLEVEARNLTDVAHPSPSAVWLEDLNRQQLSHIDQLPNAMDICTARASGRPVRTHDLADAVATLADSARAAPVFTRGAGDIDQSQWHEVLEPLTELLHQRGIDLPADEAIELDGHHLGIEL